MSKRFVPVSDPEKARCEQDEESLRKHRKFDTPHAVLAANLNEKRRPGHEDQKPLGKPTGDLELDEKGLWRKKEQIFDKPQTWGRETFEYCDPEQARSEGNEGPKWGRPGVVGWGKQGKFGGRGEDKGLSVLQRGEVNQAMELNEKGLWVKKKAQPEASASSTDGASKGHWRCGKCGKETLNTMEFCRRFECDGQRPKGAGIVSDPAALKQSNPNEDPRLEAAKKRGRGTEDAAKQALKALEERRKKMQLEKERAGLLRRPDMDRDRLDSRPAPRRTVDAQVRPAQRSSGGARWQGVQKTDQDAKRIVGKAVGGAVEASGAPLRVEDSERSSLKKVPNRSTLRDDDIAERIARSISRSRSRSGGDDEDGAVDFF